MGGRAHGGRPGATSLGLLVAQASRGMVRVRLKSGSWLAGVYGVSSTGVQSYASGYGEDGDLFLAESLAVDDETGAFELDDEDRPIRTEDPPSLLIRRSEVEYLEFEEIS